MPVVAQYKVRFDAREPTTTQHIGDIQFPPDAPAIITVGRRPAQDCIYNNLYLRVGVVTEETAASFTEWFKLEAF